MISLFDYFAHGSVTEPSLPAQAMAGHRARRMAILLGFGSLLLLHIVFKHVEKFMDLGLSHWHGQINPELRWENPVVQEMKE